MVQNHDGQGAPKSLEYGKCIETENNKTETDRGAPILRFVKYFYYISICKSACKILQDFFGHCTGREKLANIVHCHTQHFIEPPDGAVKSKYAIREE